MPATQPAIVARRSSHGQNRARKAAGSVWSVHTPPASWKLTTYVDGTARMNATAPTLTVAMSALRSASRWRRSAGA